MSNIKIDTVVTSWNNDLNFESVINDYALPLSGSSTGSPAASPKKLLLASLAGCSGMDVVSLLDKMRQKYHSFTISCEADLTSEHPKVYSEIRMSYTISGEKLIQKKVIKAISLSHERYCGVSAMLRKNCPIKVYLDIPELGIEKHELQFEEER